jgi:hypothetical protein
VPDAPKLEHHWCDCPADEFAKDYFARITKGGSFLARLQLLAHRHFYGALPAGFVGDMPSSAEVSRAGDQGESVELRINWFRAHVNAKVQIITAPKLTWTAQAINTDSKSMAGASRGAQILEAEWKQGPWEKAAIEAQLGASGPYGEDFLFPYWLSVAGDALQYQEPSEAVEASPGMPPVEPSGEFPEGQPGSPPVEAAPAKPGRLHFKGDLECNRVASWNAFCDESFAAWDASPWQSAAVARDRWDLIAQYPDKKEEILSAPQMPVISSRGPNGAAGMQSDAGKVVCHYFFHKRTPALIRGLQVVAINENCVLEFLPLAKRYYGRLPIVQYRGGVLKGSPRGYTDSWEAMAAQDLATNIQSSIATNIVAFAKQMISAETGTNLEIDQIGNGPFVQYRPKGSPPPVPMTFHLPSDGAFKHLDALRSDQRMILGLNDVAMGEAPTGTPNAQAWALLATAGVTANSGGQRDFVDSVRATGQVILAAWKECADHERTTSVIGVHGAAVPKQEKWDKQAMEPVGDVMVEIANPLSQTAAGRLQIEQLFADRGFILTPEQLTMLIETGTMKSLTQVLVHELIYITWENEELLKGVELPVMITDSHQMHIREHKDVTFSAEARSNPAIIAAANAHIQQHIAMAVGTDPMILQLLGQAAPQAPMLPPGEESAEVPSTLEQPGAAGAAPEGIKLPTAPDNPATGMPAGMPGVAA